MAETAVKRTARGTFAPGTAPGPGNPFAKQVAKYRTAIHEAFKEGHIVSVLQSLFQLAVGIDPTDPQKDVSLRRRCRPSEAAATIFLRYTVGDPPKMTVEEEEDMKQGNRMTVEEAVAELQAASGVLERARVLELVPGGKKDEPKSEPEQK